MAIKVPWIRPIISTPMAMQGVLHVIIGGCAITKLLLMRFHKAPNQAVPPCILANSVKNNSFPKTITNWGTGITPEGLSSSSTTTLQFQPSQGRGPYPNEGNIIIHVRDIRERGGHQQPNVERVINSNVLSVPRLTNADLADSVRGFGV